MSVDILSLAAFSVPKHISRETDADIKKLVHEVNTEFQIEGNVDAAQQ